MYNPEVIVVQEDFIITSTSNIISREALVCKPQAVEIPNGRCFIGPQVIIRGDLAPVQINKYCFIDHDTVLRPSYAMIKQQFKFIPVTIGSHSYIGSNCIIEAAIIGTGCYISNNCILSKRCILKDYVLVLENTVICCDMVIPPFSIVSGNPGKIIGEQSESASTLAPQAAVLRYKAVKPTKRDLIL